MKKPPLFLSKSVIFIGLGLTASQSMENSSNYAPMRTESDPLLGRTEPLQRNNSFCLRRELTTILNNKTETEKERASAQYKLADMDWYGLGIPKANHTAARNGFNAVLNNDAASPQDKESAQLRLAEMNTFDLREEDRQKKLLIPKGQLTSKPVDKDCRCVII